MLFKYLFILYVYMYVYIFNLYILIVFWDLLFILNRLCPIIFFFLIVLKL